MRIRTIIFLWALCIFPTSLFAQETGNATSPTQVNKTPANKTPAKAAQPNTPQGTLEQWELSGNLIDNQESVQAFLRPFLQEKQAWTEEDQQSAINFLFSLGYQATIINGRTENGGIKATIKMEPATLVRYVEVNIDIGNIDRFMQPIFADDIQKRMTLRPGTPLPRTIKARSSLFKAEEERIKDYLIYDGLYDAKVTIVESKRNAFEAHLQVKVTPGAPYFVGRISVEGNGRIETQDIDALFRHRRLCMPLELCVGEQRFSRKILLEDIQILKHKYQALGFPGVQISSDFNKRHSYNRKTKTVDFLVTVRERRRIDVTFEGNHSYTASLPDKMTLSEVESYDDVEVQASADNIRNFYQSKGYFETQVSWERELFQDVNYEHILMHIDQGPKLRIKKVEFEGNRAFPASTLRSLVQTRIYKRIFVGYGGGYATSERLAQDRLRILRLYRENGFHNTKVQLRVGRSKEELKSSAVLAASIAGRAKALGLFVVFEIDEGERSVIKEIKISFEGEHSQSQEYLLKKLSLSVGDSFLEKTAKDNGAKLEAHYRTLGYPRMEISTQVEEQDNQVSLHYHVREHQQARIGSIIIRGNFKTREWVIRKELDIQEGQLLTTELRKNIRANLRQTGLFSSMQIKYLGIENTRQKTVNLHINVNERFDYSRVYKATTGYSTDSQLFIGGGLGIHNIAGIGAHADLDLLLGQKHRAYKLKLQIPRWVMSRYLHTRVNLVGILSYEADDTERFGELTTRGSSLALTRLGHRGIFKDWLMSLRYNFRQRNRDIPLVRSSGNSDDILETPVTTRVSSIGPKLIIDKLRDRDGNQNPLTPGNGYRLEFKALYAEDSIFGTDQFLKFGFTGHRYWTSQSKRFTLSTGLRYDHGVPLGGVSLLPEVERFFGGGDTTVRGYEEDHLAVELIETPLAPFEGISQFRVRPAGGNIRLLHTVDLQFVLGNDPWFEFPIASALFLDTGMITNSLLDIDIESMGFGLGVALARYVTPFGALSIEYAIPLRLKLGDNPRGRYHIKLGVLF